MGISFALEWYMGWFAHSTTSFKVILKLYDYMISTKCQEIGLFMVVAVLLLNKKYIKKNIKTFSEFIKFAKNEIKIDEHSIDILIAKCNEITLKERKKKKKGFTQKKKKKKKKK